MRRLSLCLDSLPALREVSGGAEIDLQAACSLAELAGVDALRLGITEELKPVAEADVLQLERSARLLELRMPPTQSLLKVALETRPGLVLLVAEGWEGSLAAQPLDLRSPSAMLPPVIRSLEESGVAVAILVSPALDAVKAAHGLGVASLELHTGATVDLPGAERAQRLEALSDAARLASKLRMSVSVGGGLDYRSVCEVLACAPAAGTVSVGRAVIARSLLVGIDRAVRDFVDRIR